MFKILSREVKDSAYPIPTREDKTLGVQTPPEGVKTLCVQLIKSSVFIQENIKDLPVGDRLTV